MLLYAAGSFSIVFFNLILWTLILSKKKRNQVINAYLWWSFCVAAWSVGYAVTLCGFFSYDATLFWNRICHGFATLIAPSFLGLAFALTQSRSEKDRTVLRFIYGLGVILLCLDFTPLFVKGLWPMTFFKYQPLGGPAYIYFALYFAAVVIYGLVLIFNKCRHSFGNEREQLKIFLLGSTIGYAGGANLFVQAFRLSVNPVGVFFISSYVLFTGYAIYRYGFMNLEIIIRRTVVFAGLFAVIYGLFTGATVLGQEIFARFLGWNQWLILAPAVLVIIFIHEPLKKFLINTTDKFLFQKKYSPTELLKTFTHEILSLLDFNQLLHKTVSTLTEALKLESCAVLLLNRSEDTYLIQECQGFENRQVSLKTGSALVAYLKKANDHLAYSDDLPADVKSQMNEIKARLLIALSHQGETIGFLSLGGKKSGEDYSREDIDILTALARTEAVAISNAKFFSEAKQNVKLAAIGALASGINHEVCNPLNRMTSTIQIFLKSKTRGLYAGKSDQELQAMSDSIMLDTMDEIKKIASITRKLSDFSKPEKEIIQERVNIGENLEAVLGVLGHQFELKRITFKKKIDPSLFIMADRDQIQEIFFNIIRNAIQATDPQGRITFLAYEKEGKVMIDIADTGCGIPEDKLHKIYMPFYTTKSESEGTGLGLAIVRQIVLRNKGSIHVKSKVGEGTVFTLEFQKA